MDKRKASSYKVSHTITLQQRRIFSNHCSDTESDLAISVPNNNNQPLPNPPIHPTQPPP